MQYLAKPWINLSAHLNSALQCTLGHSICEIWMLLIKKRNNCTFLLASLAKVDRFKSYKSGDLKNRTATVLLSRVFYLWIPLCFLPVWGDSGRSSPLKFPFFSTSSPTESTLQARPPPLPLFRFLMKVGATGRAEIHGPHVSLTPESGLSAPGEMHSCLHPTAGGKLEVTAPKYSSLGALYKQPIGW